MKLSKLQKFILIQCKNFRQKQVPRREFLKFYPSTRSASSALSSTLRLRPEGSSEPKGRSGPPLRSTRLPRCDSGQVGTGRSGASKKKIPSREDQYNIITKSLMRLIRKDVLVGFGEITREKIFVERVRLTQAGRREVKRLLDKQQRLPLRIKKRRLNKT